MNTTNNSQGGGSPGGVINNQPPSTAPPQGRSNNSVDEVAPVDVEAGIDEATLMNYPKLLYAQVKAAAADHGAKEEDAWNVLCCSIFLADYKDANVLRRLPDCKHLLHLKVCGPMAEAPPHMPRLPHLPAADPPRRGGPPGKAATMNIHMYIHLVQVEYLRTTVFFLPPANSSASCWTALQTEIDQVFPGFDPRSACGFRTEWISTGCMNISSLSQFRPLANASSTSVLSDVNQSCNRSLSSSICASCTSTVTHLNAFLTGPDNGNVSDCYSSSSTADAICCPVLALRFESGQLRE
ncbi:hypothetical protein Taro_029599 [Colocasia esculenta]|uniref:SPARK domain-containing protein n=1 Tax=Colocasia esculenta TaxID=4460 RepID=A0A843VTN8_COLES|nr:hypothetical protein [Colocasia esculenta]